MASTYTLAQLVDEAAEASKPKLKEPLTSPS